MKNELLFSEGVNYNEMAGIFKEYLETTHRCFAQVIFAIPEGKDGWGL